MPWAMRLHYINLEREKARRDCLEANFSQHNSQAWTLARFAAIDASAPGVVLPSSPLRPAETACFLSHRGALERAAAEPGHAMIAEDDVWFGPSSQRVIGAALGSMPASWDLLYTDVCVSNLHLMIDLFLLQRQRAGKPALLPLSGVSYAGATAYVVNERAKSRLAGLAAGADLALPYDLWLRQQVSDGRLAAFVTLPFATTLSSLAERSQIQAVDINSINFVWNAYRRLILSDAEPDAVLAHLADIDLGAVATDEAVMIRLLAQVVTGRARGR